MKYYIELDENDYISASMTVVGDHTKPGAVDPEWIEVSEDYIDKLWWLYNRETGETTEPYTLKERKIREKRNELLETVVDPLVSNTLRWADLTEAKQAEWTQYRRDLLDITDQAGFPTEVTWPTQPE